MSTATNKAINWVEHGYVPDSVIRHSIRRLLKSRLESLPVDDPEAAALLEQSFVRMMDAASIAPVPEKANEQHYELPPRFFELSLGLKNKYSCCFWPRGVRTLDQAEVAALQATCEHAEIEDGMQILELGCGWGSLTLWMAECYPNSRITAVSNSAAQRSFIEARAEERELDNVTVLTRDMNEFGTEEQFDRVVSVEMFEHMRNYRQLFSRINDWLLPGGKFFMHIFCHRSCPYEFEDRGPADWMSRHFFSGGIMPSDDLPLRFQDHLKLRRRWRWNGRHYEQTCNAWLEEMDLNEDEVMTVLTDTYGEDAPRWWMRWRMFYMACAELFGYDEGRQWWVSHYLFEKPAATGAAQ
ncbi:MAG: cyclopropane-fatty-acyl-phospholipid synthase family protein [Gammaproteobacteria bacterium]|nr:cyclopropane-fatty-acyl-phospholipid synthase family protein [Gammaproteobacteria bacterium]